MICITWMARVFSSDEEKAWGRNVGEERADLIKDAERDRCSPWPRACHDDVKIWWSAL